MRPRALLPALLGALMLAVPAAAKPQKPTKPPPSLAAPATEGGTSEPAAPATSMPIPAAEPPEGSAAAQPPPPPPVAAQPPDRVATPPAAEAPAGHLPRPADPPPPPLPAPQPAAAPPRPAFPPQPAVEAIPGHLAGLAAWAGCSPHCTAAASRAGMRLRSNFVLQFPPLRAELERMLGRRPLQDLLRIAETGPVVERRDDWVRIALCRQEACATEFMVLFAHLTAGEIVLCWHEEHWDAPRLRWSDNRGGVWRTGAAGRQPLPPEGCNNRGPLDGHDWDLLRRLADG